MCNLGDGTGLRGGWALRDPPIDSSDLRGALDGGFVLCRARCLSGGERDRSAHACVRHGRRRALERCARRAGWQQRRRWRARARRWAKRDAGRGRRRRDRRRPGRGFRRRQRLHAWVVRGRGDLRRRRLHLAARGRRRRRNPGGQRLRRRRCERGRHGATIVRGRVRRRSRALRDGGLGAMRCAERLRVHGRADPRGELRVVRQPGASVRLRRVRGQR